MRDKIGSFMTAENVASFLNRWIANYVLLDDDAGQDVKAQVPAARGPRRRREIPGKPGAYRRWRSCGRTSSSKS